MTEVTRILTSIEQGNAKAAEELLPLVYTELRRLAARKMAHERPGQTLQPTALVHEAWLRLAGDQNQKWDNRGHFFAAAAEAMRRILIENARRKKSLKRGVEFKRVNLQDVQVAIFFRELPDQRYRVSLRSKGEVNVSAVAEHFGGGGHKCASGCSLDGPLDVAVSRIVDRLHAEPCAQKL